MHRNEDVKITSLDIKYTTYKIMHKAVAVLRKVC